jgi:colanic acid biosynthesis glycosyl transferase WcaI
LAISEGFREIIISKGISQEKISVVPVWADTDFVFPKNKDNEFRRKFKLAGKFVLLYTGNLGVASYLEDVLDAAELLNEEEGIQFILLGEGVKKKQLIESAKKKVLKNVMFLSYQPREEYPEVLASSDVGLVTLNPVSGSFSLPSKTFNIMASGRPILSIAMKNSDIDKLITMNVIGLNVPPGNPENLAKAIISLRNNNKETLEMGNRARFVCEESYSRYHCVLLYETRFEEIIRRK